MPMMTLTSEGSEAPGSLLWEILLRGLNADPAKRCINEPGPHSLKLPALSFPSYYMHQITGSSAGFPVKEQILL